MPPLISIVIPTYQRENMLQMLLDSLLDQSVLPSKYEIVVVDNAPIPHVPTQELCQSSRYSLLSLKCVHTPISGISQARNFGMRHTTAEWVAFLDDDEKVPLHWVERAIDIVNEFTPDFLGGPLHPIYLESKPAWFKDTYVAYSLGVYKGWLEKDESFSGGNLIVQRGWLDRLKGFSTDMGRRENHQAYGEDIELQHRARQLGAKFYHDPELYVFHHVLSNQFKAGWFFKRAWRQGKAVAGVFACDERGGKPAIIYGLVQLKNTLGQVFYVAGLFLYTPFRNKSVAVFKENYLVESVATAIYELSKSWFSFLSIFKKKA